MRKSTSDIVFQYLKEGILNKKWGHGERITPEIQLARELSVGRNAVREAIEKLVGLNLLIKIKGKGTFTNLESSNAQFNNFIVDTILAKDEYLDILIFRESFEVKNVELFIRNATIDNYNELIKCYENMTLFQDSHEKFPYYDALFHKIIAKGTKNTIIIKISETLSELMTFHQKSLNHLLGSSKGISEHQSILNAILEKDMEIATLMMRRHILRTIKDVKETKKEDF